MTSARYSPATTTAVQWPLVFGLGSMALLWPLTALTGIGGTGAPRALAIVGLTVLVWIGVVGLGRVARPVLTLTLTGLVFGLIAIATSLVFGGVGLPGEDAAAWTVIPALAMDAFWGFVAGLIALGVQKARGEGR
jgi:hypothetical protein